MARSTSDTPGASGDRTATDGRTPRRVPVTLPAMETPAGGWLRGMRVSGFSLLMLVIIVLFVIILAPSLKTLIQQQQQITSLQSDVDKQKQNVDDLKDDVARWDDPAYIEAQARDRLLYVYPGEYSYLVMDDAATKAAAGAKTDAGATITKDIQNPTVDWVGAMTASVLDAGLTDAPASKLVAPDLQGTK